uniref:Uncharacterized protein n=1 Tax=Opuntia streptacantha TaxID=393608 RepID=A0A7C9AU53_OPUST
MYKLEIVSVFSKSALQLCFKRSHFTMHNVSSDKGKPFFGNALIAGQFVISSLTNEISRFSGGREVNFGQSVMTKLRRQGRSLVRNPLHISRLDMLWSFSDSSLGNPAPAPFPKN